MFNLREKQGEREIMKKEERGKENKDIKWCSVGTYKKYRVLHKKPDVPYFPFFMSYITCIFSKHFWRLVNKICKTSWGRAVPSSGIALLASI